MKRHPPCCGYADGMNRICDFDGNPCNYWMCKNADDKHKCMHCIHNPFAILVRDWFEKEGE
jgi:hypothetical protein